MSVKYTEVVRVSESLNTSDLNKAIPLSIYSLYSLVRKAKWDDDANDHLDFLCHVISNQDRKLCKINMFFDNEKECDLFTKEYIKFISDELDLNVQDSWQVVLTHAALNHNSFGLTSEYKNKILKGLDG